MQSEPAVSASGAPEAEAEDWVAMQAVLDEFVDERHLQDYYRDFSGELLGTSYEMIGEEAFVERSRALTFVALAGARQRRTPAPDEDDAELRATGRSRAAGGVELSDLVRMTLFGQKTQFRAISDLSRERGVPDATLIEALQYLDAWSAWTLRALMAGYQEVALEAATQVHRRQDRAMRQLLAGGLTPVEVTQAAIECGLDPRGAYLVLRVPSEELSIDEIRRGLAAAGLAVGEYDALTTLYGDVCLIVPELPSGEVPFGVGVSPPVGVGSLAEGFRLATRSAEAAQQLGRSGFVTMWDLSIAAAIAVDQEVVQLLRARYLDPFAELGAAGQGILDTVAEYFAQQRNVAVTAKRLFVHVNTVRYRLERFEAITECSLRDVRTITEVWWVLQTRAAA